MLIERKLETMLSFNDKNAKYMLDLDHVISLRLAGGSYRAIAELTGWSIAKIRRVCQEEGC
jgi:hypothetical protein